MLRGCRQQRAPHPPRDPDGRRVGMAAREGTGTDEGCLNRKGVMGLPQRGEVIEAVISMSSQCVIYNTLR